MNLKHRFPDSGLRYSIYLMSLQTIVLIFYTAANLTILSNYSVAVIAALLALLIFIEVAYQIRFKKIMFNHNASLTGFILLLLLLPFLRDTSQRGGMWVFILPLVVFSTQKLRKSIIIISIFIFLAALTQMHASFGLLASRQPYSVEQMVVFLIIVLCACMHKRVIHTKEQKILEHLYRDSLTGLYNRNKLIADLKNLNESVILMLINIDNFKEINELFGTHTGDKVIMQLSKIISRRHICTSYPEVYRLHSDEYALVFNCDEIEECSSLAENLLRDLSEPISVRGDELLITVSIGISDCSESPLINADIALKKAKESKRNIVFYKDSMKPMLKYDENRQNLLRLKKALQKNNLLPYYQPILNISENRITKYESLARLIDGDAIIGPGSFIEISKRAKLYSIITRLMICKVFESLKNSDCTFSINISYDDISNEDTLGLIYRKIPELDDPSRLIFELLETEHFSKFDKVHHFIKTVKAFGCKIAVDDFGSGYSNFNYILSLNVDFIKIDASLIKNIDTDYSSEIITRSIVTFAKEMGIETIAEYVHKKEVFDKVRELGIDYAQGFFIGSPKPKLLDFTPAPAN